MTRSRSGRTSGPSDAAPHAFGLWVTNELYRQAGGSARYQAFAQQQLNFALGANAWGSSFVVGAGTVYPHCMQSEIANLAGSLTGRGNIQLGAVTDGPSSPANFIGLGTVSGMRACSAGRSPLTTARRQRMRTTCWRGPRSSRPTTTRRSRCSPSPWERRPGVADDRAGVAPAVLAIDGGNSKTDVALVADDGTTLASVRGPGASHEEFGLAEAMRRIDKLVRIVGAQAGGSPGGLVARHTSACLAGADLPEEEAQLTAAIQEQGWSLTSAVANDTFAVLRAGLTPRDGERPWGIAVTCGAGINCVGVAPDGRTTRFLAFGALSGDWGGGQGLGRAAMWWAMRAEDGRGQPTALRAAVAAFYGMPSVHDVVVAFHLGHLTEDDLMACRPSSSQPPWRATRWPGTWWSGRPRRSPRWR